MLIDEIANRNNLKKINPMEKFIFSMGLLIILTFCDNYWIHILNIIVINIFLIVLVKISIKELIRLYKAVLFFIILTNISFILNGENSLILTLKAIDSISIVYFMFCTTPVTQMAFIMRNLKFPKIIIELFLLIYRFIFLFTEVKNRFVMSQKSRLGYKNLKTSYKSIALMVSNMFYKMFVYSEKSSVAVKSRVGGEFIFWEEKFEKNKNFRYIYLYLFLIIVGVICGKV